MWVLLVVMGGCCSYYCGCYSHDVYSQCVKASFDFLETCQVLNTAAASISSRSSDAIIDRCLAVMFCCKQCLHFGFL